MSDPVTNVEIEDVLSSIRRLVSNDARNADEDAAGSADESTDSDEAPEAPKLVLTPSFRVDEAHAGDTQADETEAEEMQGDDPLPDAAQSIDVPGAAAEDGERGHVAPEDGRANAGDDQDPPTAEPATGSDDTDTDTPAAADVLRSRVAELEQVVAGRSEQWEPDGASDDDYAGAPVEPLPWEDYVPSDTGGDADGHTESDARDAAEAEPEERPQAPEDDATISSEDHDDTAPQAEAEPFSDQDTPMPEAAESQDRLDDGEEAANLLGLDEESDAILDEDALRDLVTEIVRQELQGGLGERITRNVRKLVRREIHRALASQELE